MRNAITTPTFPGLVLPFELHGQEEIPVAPGLGDDEDGEDVDGCDRGKGELHATELGAGHAGGEGRQDERERRQGGNRREGCAAALGIELSDPVPAGRGEQGDGKDAIARDHHGGEHGVARQPRSLRSAGRHEGDDLRVVDRSEDSRDERDSGGNRYAQGDVPSPGSQQDHGSDYWRERWRESSRSSSRWRSSHVSIMPDSATGQRRLTRTPLLRTLGIGFDQRICVRPSCTPLITASTREVACNFSRILRT